MTVMALIDVTIIPVINNPHLVETRRGLFAFIKMNEFCNTS